VRRVRIERIAPESENGATDASERPTGDE